MYKIFETYNIPITEEQIHKFDLYYQLLIEWNNKMNLTTITDYNEVIKKHFLDSCLLLNKYSSKHFCNSSIIDVGTGAGFPGIPLSIFLPDTKFTLVDSLSKRIDFLSVLVDQLELSNVELYHGRAENLGRDIHFREQFDYCVSRAVANLPLLLEYCSPFIKKDGQLLLYKSKKITQEIEEANHALCELNCSIKDSVQLAEGEFERYLLVIQKDNHTPEKYPRKAGKPKKKPL